MSEKSLHGRWLLATPGWGGRAEGSEMGRRRKPINEASLSRSLMWVLGPLFPEESWDSISIYINS